MKYLTLQATVLFILFLSSLSLVINGEDFGKEFGKSYALNTTGLFSTPSNLAIGMKFFGDGIDGSYVVNQEQDLLNIYNKFPIVNVTDGNELTLFGVYSLNLTNAVYNLDDNFFLYISYFMGVMNYVPETLNLLLLDDSNTFVPLPKVTRERIYLKTVNATFRDYQNVIHNNVLYMGTFGKFVVQHSQIETYVNISYPQYVNFDLDNHLNQTLDVYFYNWYGSIPDGKPLRYIWVPVFDQIEYPSPSYISLHKFKVVDTDGSPLYYNGYGLRNYVFHFDADSLLDYYSKHYNETLVIESLACGYQKKNSNKYIDNGRSKVNLKEGTLSCDDTIGDDIQSVTIMVRKVVKTTSIIPVHSSGNIPVHSSSKIPTDYSTIIVAVTASAFGALLIVFAIIIIAVMMCCLRNRKKYQEINE